MELYDTIGRGYPDIRQPDPRLAAAILQALGPASSVVNVGAGTGAYEPRGRRVVAVELSMTMIRQRGTEASPVVQASATSLPFRDESFDASLAILTVHHWLDRARGLRELRRVARQHTVILTWDPSAPAFWLADYFPEIFKIDRRIFPPVSGLAHILGKITVSDILIPHDCRDGFLGAYWRRPEAYLDPKVRGAISTFSKLRAVDGGVDRLRKDLESGKWHDRNVDLLHRAVLDLGYRLVVAGNTI
jgi:SAM-dependent methyltransferase